MGLLALVDRTALAMYCDAVSRYMELRDNRDVAPYVLVQLQSSIRSWCQQFGLTPSARSRITLPDKGEEDRFDAVFG